MTRGGGPFSIEESSPGITREQRASEKPRELRMLPEFLRQKAAECDDLRRNCYDLEIIKRLRIMADELRAKANEMEGKTPRQN